jgi:hypothetical protein
MGVYLISTIVKAINFVIPLIAHGELLVYPEPAEGNHDALHPSIPTLVGTQDERCQLTHHI